MFQNMHKLFIHKMIFRGLVMLALASGLSPLAAAPVLEHRDLAQVLEYLDGYQPEGVSHERRLPFPALINELAEKRVVFVGEIHDRYDHHLNQLAILRALQQKTPNIAIGVEWFQQTFQLVLNDYLAGKISEAELLQRSEYYDRWRYDFRLLRPILEFARENRLPVIALNAPVELTRKVSGGGLEALSAAERAQLPEEILPADKVYRARLQKVFEAHSDDSKQFENFMLVQRIWDETMANNISRYLEANPQHGMVVFSGSGHITHGTGIPADLQRRMPELKLATVTSSSAQEVQPGLVDYFVLSEELALPPTGKLGVMLEVQDDGVGILDLLRDGAADKAGLQKGDRLAQVEGINIISMADLKTVLARFPPGRKVKVAVARRGKDSLQAYEVTLQ